ncbi:MAG TPA: RlmE family RNA methyltransferase [Candidatus Peribacteraceae bacterium]|nr:RlmE family RNA methyltransferase [Candidatus Peribacteraceae bacterium]
MPKPYVPNDKWSQKAQEMGYRARSVFKLMELDERFSLLKPKMRVLDLGAAPGSWLQYVAEKIGPEGVAIGLDLQKIEEIAPNVRTAKADITDIPAVYLLLQALLSHERPKVDIVLCDLAPNTSGIRDIDQWRSIELNEAAVALASKVLNQGGGCVLKVFRGADFDEFFTKLKIDWTVRLAHVAASRDRSSEVYLVMKRKRAQTKTQVDEAGSA